MRPPSSAHATLVRPASSEPHLGAQPGAAPAGRCKARHHPGRTGLHLDLEGNTSAQVLTETARVTSGTLPPHPWWTDEVWTTVCGQVASIASGNPVSPSQQAINTSWTPRLRSSANTPAQNFAPSAVCTQIPSTCLIPSTSTPTAMWAALLRTWTINASRYKIG